MPTITDIAVVGVVLVLGSIFMKISRHKLSPHNFCANFVREATLLPTYFFC